jgi:hypothetical protein
VAAAVDCGIAQAANLQPSKDYKRALGAIALATPDAELTAELPSWGAARVPGARGGRPLLDTLKGAMAVAPQVTRPKAAKATATRKSAEG